MKKIIDVYNSLVIRKYARSAGAKFAGISLSEYDEIRKLISIKLRKFKPIFNNHLRDTIINSFENEGCITKDLLNLEKALKNVDTEKSKMVSSHTDIDTGKVRLEAYSTIEPKTPEEIINILNIDITKWRLSQYWNKQKGTGWLISALVTQISKEESALLNFFETIHNYSFPKAVISEERILNLHNAEVVCGVMSLQDLHFGKKGNENITEIMLSVVRSLLSMSSGGFYMENLVLVLGGDALNMDTFVGTTTKGTLVESSMNAQDTYIQAFEGLYLLLLLLKSYTNKLNIVFIPGNHDRLSSFHLLHALSKSFEGLEGFSFNMEYSERKVVTYGENMFAFEHGDVSRKTTPLVYATEFPNEWGQTTYRTLFTGHYHMKKTIEYITENEIHGFSIKILPSLSSTDYWHSHNKFVGNKRTSILELYSRTEGKIGEFNKTYKL